MAPNHPIAWEALRPLVILVGSGMWSEVVARLVFRSGGSAVVVDSVDDLGGLTRAACVVLGAPLSPADMIRSTVAIRERMPIAPVIAALEGNAASEELASDLAIVGAAAVPDDGDMHQVSNWIGRYAGLNIRHTHRGILMAPVLLRSGHTLHAAIASDVSEGGLGVEAVDATLVQNVEEVQFHVPGFPAPITVATDVVWVEASDRSRVRAGLRFRDLDPIDLAAIRAFQGDADESMVASP